MIIDGQFGSTGKGLAASYIATKEHVDVAISNSSPNAGHSFDIGDGKRITRHLPVVGVLNDRSTIYLCAGSIIDPYILLKEMDLFQVHHQVTIHPRASIIEKCDIEAEKDWIEISSTRKGVGSALSRKIKRKAALASDCKELHDYVGIVDIERLLDEGCIAVMETPQGFDLSINSGFSYPYCTSREITVAQALSDAQVHPNYLGNVMMIIRTFPIRVGNIVEKGEVVGWSGPFYDDSNELSFKEIGVDPEKTTVTGKVRRVATFSLKQYKRALKMIKPSHVFLNFANYMDDMELATLLDQLSEHKDVSYIGFGPSVSDVMVNTFLS